MKKSVFILAIVFSIVLIYQFIVRPIQSDKKLQECLNVPIRNATGTPQQIKDFEDYCFKKYGKR